jgi:hypothetical protein
MKRLLGCIALLGLSLFAQNMQSTLLALKDANAPRKILSNRLVEEMMAQAKRNQTPSRAAVQRLSEDLTTALVGRDITTIRASILQKSLADLMCGKGSTFLPASNLREVLIKCGVDEPTVQQIVQRFIDVGQEVRGPDDIPVRPKFE